MPCLYRRLGGNGAMGRALVVGLGLALLAAGLLPARGRAAEFSPFAALLDQRMPELLARYAVPGSVISYIEDGDVAWTRAYGLADRSSSKAMQPDMVFEHGSDGKALTAWAVMRLVEQGKVDLDAPANRYLRRWQIPSGQYDANEVSVRRLLSHTGGLSIHGYVDYSPRRRNLPDLTAVLTGAHLAEGLVESLEMGRPSLGNAAIVVQPGSAYKYSGAGYTLLQMIVEDVSGEPFDAFIRREVTDPLGATGMRWAWTPELIAAAPVPYGNEGQALPYRQLVPHAIGSEIATVADYARFLVAIVPGPHGEPAGRGVLKPETVQAMTKPQPATDGGYGLGYATGTDVGEPAVTHSGANPGWTAFYFLDITRRTGFVVASNSSRAGPLHNAILGLWSAATFGPNGWRDPPAEPSLDMVALLTLGLAGLSGLGLLVALARFAVGLARGRRTRLARPTARGLLLALPWFLWLAFIWYTVYARLPLSLPAAYPDLWPSPALSVLVGVLVAWVVFRVTTAFYRIENAQTE